MVNKVFYVYVQLIYRIEDRGDIKLFT